jgi:hypothetical protein
MNKFQKLMLSAISAALLVTACASDDDDNNNTVDTTPTVTVDTSVKAIGEVTALIPEASTADDASERVDGQSGDTDFPYIDAMKPIATIGEYDDATGLALTGYPDGHAAWLEDHNTIRVAYQSESYSTMSNETYGWEMASGVKFTGSHIHTIDYDRTKFADFLANEAPASDMVKTTGHLFSTVYNQFGDVVTPKADGGKWGNQTYPDGTVVNFAASMQLTEGDFFFQSFCGAYYEKAHKYGNGIGLADDVWLTAEEWNISSMFSDTGIDTNDTLGLASMVVDIANKTAYAVPSLGQSGYEKILPINPKHEDYVVMVLAGYNHYKNVAPLRIYVGKKGVDWNNQAVDQNDPNVSERDKFLARNGLLYGKIYGMALENSEFANLNITNDNLTAEMMDEYLKDASAPNNFSVKFFPTSYQWAGWDNNVSVGDTEISLWIDANEQPDNHTFLNANTKTEHPAVDPDDTKQRYVQNMTNEGALVGVELTDFVNEVAGGDLPASVSADVTRIISAVDGSLTLEVGGKGIGHGDDPSATAAKHIEADAAKMVAPDGLQWIKTSDADVLIVDEDSGNDYGERKYALVLDPATLQLKTANTGHFLAMAGGSDNPRGADNASAYGGAVRESGPTSAEFSGTWNVTALVAKKADGTFYTEQELEGQGEQDVNESVSLAGSSLIGVVQHRTDSGGAVAEVKADAGGQVFLFSPENIPTN